MAFMTKEDKTVVQSMQTSDAELKEIEKAKKNKGKRSRGEHYTLKEFKAKHGGAILFDYDKEVADKNWLENYRILKECGMSDKEIDKLIGDCKTDNGKRKKKINPLAEERCIEMEVCDDYCRVYVSHDSIPFYAQMTTRFGKPKQNKTFTGGYYWTIDANSFTFGGRRYSTAKTASPNYHTYTSVIWTSKDPDRVYIETSDSRWANNIEKLDEKFGCEPHHRRAVREDMDAEEIAALPVSGRSATHYEWAAFFPVSALDVPSKKK